VLIKTRDFEFTVPPELEDKSTYLFKSRDDEERFRVEEGPLTELPTVSLVMEDRLGELRDVFNELVEIEPKQQTYLAGRSGWEVRFTFIDDERRFRESWVMFQSWKDRYTNIAYTGLANSDEFQRRFEQIKNSVVQSDGPARELPPDGYYFYQAAGLMFALPNSLRPPTVYTLVHHDRSQRITLDYRYPSSQRTPNTNFILRKTLANSNIKEKDEIDVQWLTGKVPVHRYSLTRERLTRIDQQTLLHTDVKLPNGTLVSLVGTDQSRPTEKFRKLFETVMTSIKPI
jgi:hypothetical protein